MSAPGCGCQGYGPGGAGLLQLLPLLLLRQLLLDGQPGLLFGLQSLLQLADGLLVLLLCLHGIVEPAGGGSDQVTDPVGGTRHERCRPATSRPRRRPSLVLQQFVVLPQLAELRAYAPLRAAQGADLAAQILLHLPARLQICFQPLNVLLQPAGRRKGIKQLTCQHYA